MRINIAIDGPSAAGKSTIAKRLASSLNYIHLDTGAMYRSVALAARRANVDLKDEETIKTLLPNIDISFDSLGHVFINGEDVSEAIRTNENSLAASAVSTLLSVRQDLVSRQQKFAAAKGIIMDGRDIGTVVLPDAELKVFMTASAESRAERRYKENLSKGIESDFDQLVKEINDRDYQDSHRENSPLKQAEDAILLDTSNLSIDEVVDAINQMLNERFPEGVAND